MPSLKLTKNEIAKLPAPHPSGKQTLYWDTELRGFGVLVSGATQAKTYVVQHTMQNGQTRRMTIAPVNVLELDDACARAKKLIGQFYSGVDPKAERRKARELAQRAARGTLRAVLDDYLTEKRKLRDSSRQHYRAMIERYLTAWLDKPLCNITRDMVKQRHTEIAREIAARNAGSRRGGAPTQGQTTANTVMRVLAIIWIWASDPDRMPELGPRPTSSLGDRWFEQSSRKRLVKADDLPAFYKAVDGLSSRTMRDYLLLMLFSGLRRREAAGLRWGDIDFAAKLIRLPAERTKADRQLDLPMSSFVRDLLIARRALGRDGDFIFPGRGKSGGVVDPTGVFEVIAKTSGIKVSSHDLRRTFVTNAEASDISPMALKALVNHALPESDQTANYVQMTVNRLREPTQRVCDRLMELCGIAPATTENVSRLA